MRIMEYTRYRVVGEDAIFNQNTSIMKRIECGVFYKNCPLYVIICETNGHMRSFVNAVGVRFGFGNGIRAAGLVMGQCCVR